jgi:hypothetical protein
MDDVATGGVRREDDAEPEAGTSAVGELVTRCAARVLRGRRHGLVRLRDLLAPVWAEVLHETMFGCRCPPGVRTLIVAEAGAWFTAPTFPGPGRRSPPLTTPEPSGTEPSTAAPNGTAPIGAGRNGTDPTGTELGGTELAGAASSGTEFTGAGLGDAELGGYLAARAGDARGAVPGGVAGVVYLRDVFGMWVARLTEESAHVLMVLARRADLQYEAGADPTLLEAVVEETSRRHAVPRGRGPLAAAAQQTCPLGQWAPDAVRAVVEEIIWRYAITTTASHSRDLGNRGPCLLVPRSGRARALPLLRGLLLWLWVRDRWEDLRRAVLARPGARPLPSRGRRPCREPFLRLTRDGGVGSFR